MKTLKRAYTGYSLVELLVVIGIIATLSTLLYVGLRNRDRSTKLEKCKANLQQISMAMESFKANDGEFIHSGEYKYRSGGTITSKSLNFGTAEGGDFYNSADEVDIVRLKELGDIGMFSAFRDLPVQCPADKTTRSLTSSSYKVVLNPYNYTIFCTCGQAHGCPEGYPRFVYGTGSEGVVTIDAKIETGN